MNNIEIHPLLLPYKYKIKTKGPLYSSLKDPLLNRAKLLEPVFRFADNLINEELLVRLNNDNLNMEDKYYLHALIYKYLLEELKKSKKFTLGDKYKEDAVLKEGWVRLKLGIDKPIYFFQDLYFQYLNSKIIYDTFNLEFASIIEEILRDEIVTEQEKLYIKEKAEDFQINQKIIDNFLEQYYNINPAFKKIVYEVCKDGVITEVEQGYLVEKSKQYLIPKDRIIDEINRALNLIKMIHHSFNNEDFYNTVNVLFLLQFISQNDLSDYYLLLETIHDAIQKSELRTLGSIQNQFLNIILSEINYSCIAENIIGTNTTVENVLTLLGLKYVSFDDIHERLLKYKVKEFDFDELNERLKQIEQVKEVHKPVDNKFTIGNDHYEIEFIRGKEYPLFSYDTIGNRIIITINRDHFFFRNELKFMLSIISIVSNLRRHYDNEDLIDDIKQLFNPPALLRIKFSDLEKE